jgi:serine/threonine-protein kinase Chk2
VAKDAKGMPKSLPKEEAPAHNRQPGEFMGLGGKGDQELFGYDGNSIYPEKDIANTKTKA